MLTLVMFLALLWQFYLGYSRGLVKQVYLLLALVVAWLVAQSHYLNLAQKLTFWVPYIQAVEEKTLVFFPEVSIFDMDKVFYSGVAFLAVFTLVYLGLKACALLLHLFPLGKLDTTTYNLISGGLSLLVTVVFWSCALRLLATVPFDQVQKVLTGSPLVQLMIKFPLVSQLLNHLWVAKVLG